MWRAENYEGTRSAVGEGGILVIDLFPLFFPFVFLLLGSLSLSNYFASYVSLIHGPNADDVLPFFFRDAVHLLSTPSSAPCRRMHVKEGRVLSSSTMMVSS